MDVVEIEETIIGILLNDRQYLSEVNNMICPADFTDPMLGISFEGINSFHQQRKTISPHSIGMGYAVNALRLLDLKKKCVSTENILSWCVIMREKSAHQLSAQRRFALYLEETAEELMRNEATKEWLHNVLFSISQDLYALMKET